MRHRWGIFVAVVAAAALTTSLFVSPATASGGRATTARGSNLKVTIAVQKFARTSRGRTIARGLAVARLNDYTGQSTTLKVPVTLSVSRGGTCRILTLTLDKLHLTLLGLNVDLSKVNLTVTGQRRGGILGSLFCALARSHVASSKAAAIRALNAHLRHHALHPMGFTVPLSPKTTTSQVTLTITATPGGGALGDLFCSLSH